MTPTLETARLRLGSWRLEHFEPLATMLACEQTTRFIGGMADAPIAWSILHARVGSWTLHGFGHFAVEEKATGRFAGWAGIFKPFDWPEHELGYALARPFWRLGYATEAARAARSWAFGALRPPSLVSYIHPDNAASIRVAGRLGARLDGMISLRGKPAQVHRHDRTGPPSA